MKALAFFLLAALPLYPAEPRCYGEGPVSGSAGAVVVSGVAQAHTTQVTARRPEDALRRLDSALRQAGSSLDDAVKIHIVVARADVVPQVAKALAGRFPDPNKRPTVTLVAGDLADPRAAVAMDAVGLSRSRAAAVDRRGQAAVLPAGPRVYISGQAVGKELMEATGATLDALRVTLASLGLDLTHVVQVKSFMRPLSRAPEVKKQIEEFFGKPIPQVFVHWTNPNPIEIELIAMAAPARVSEPMQFLTPAGMTASPIFSRVVRIDHPGTIYISGLYGKTPKEADPQIREVFDSLKTILEKTGGDLRHLAKATYYVSDDAASRRLNDLRPDYYDPKRPPAASKASVPGTGFEGRTFTMDMIAVPVR